MASKLQVDVGVNFQAEGKQLDQYVNKVAENIKAIQNGTGKKDAFSGTQKAIDDVVKEFDKLSKMKLNTENVNEYVRQQDKLRQAIAAVNQAAAKESSDLTAKQEKYNNTITAAKEKQEELQKIISRKPKDDGSLPTDKEVQAATKSYNGYTGVIKKAENGLKALNVQAEKQEQILAGTKGATEQANKVLVANSELYQKVARTEADAHRQETINAIKKKIQYYTSLAFSIRLVRQQLKQAIDTFQQVDKYITSISMVSGISRDTLWGNIGEYNKLAQELGTTTDKVLQASQLYYQQGRNTVEVIDLTRESLTLAALAELNTADATNYLTAAVNGYKMEASEAGEVTDVWAQLAAKNAVSVKELAISMSKVASIAQSAGMDIQSTSAFLTQMIATTREAPENLGTALKTIIARFQELKMGAEELEDGVDANKVEKALRTVGISLRDTTGQFRDFDDVILELSSKWDSLDRNTQRYIATIAAGSRMQSRFIALVSDYDGLVEIVNQAANAEGAASEQFSVYSTGMEAALNRVKNAWIGFYTSWSDGHNIVTGVLNSITEIINTFSKIGITGTVGLGALILAISKMGVAMLTTGVSAKQYLGSLKGIQVVENLLLPLQQKRTLNLNKETIATNFQLAAQGKLNDKQVEQAANLLADAGLLDADTLAKLTNADSALTLAEKNQILANSQKAVIATNPAGIFLIIVSAIMTLIPLISNVSGETKKLEEHIGELNERASVASQNAKSAAQYAESLENAVKAGEDLTDIREQLANTFRDEIKNVDWATDSWNILIEALEKYEKEQQKIAAGSEYNAAISDRNLNDNAQKKELDDLFTIDLVTNTYYLNGTDQIMDEASAKEYLAEINSKLEKSTISLSVATQAAKAAFSDNYTAEQVNNIAKAIQYFDESLLKLNEETGEVEYTNNALLNEILGYGNLENANDQLLTTLQRYASEDGYAFLQTFRDSLASSKQVLNDQLTAVFGDPQIVASITEQLSPAMIREFAVAAESLGQDEGLRQEFQNGLATILKNIDVSELSEGTFQAFADAIKEGQDGLMEYYDTLISIGPDGEAVISDYAENVSELLLESNKAFVEGKKAVDDYNQGLKEIDELTSASSLDEYAQKVWQLSLNYQELGYATQAELLAEIWGNTVRDESGNYIIQEGSLLASLRDEYDLNNAAARNNAITTLKAEIKKMIAFRDALQAHYDYVIGELDAYEASESGAIDNAVVSEDSINSIIENYNQTMNDLDKDAAALGAQVLGLGGIAEVSNTGDLSTKNVREYANKIKGQIDAVNKQIATATQQLGMLQAMNLASPTKGGGGGGGGSSSAKESTKETKKLSEAMKEAADAASKLAKAMQSAAKSEIDSIKSVLEKQKALAEDRKKRAEEELDAVVRHNKMYWEEYKKLYEDQLKLLKDKIEKEKQLLDDETDDINAILGYINDSYDNQIDTIQAKIDALDKEAEAEDRLRKLQEARDAYERARNQRTRLVLTQGAGWIFKTDTEALNQARIGLEDAQRDYQKAVLQDEIDKINDIKDLWADSAKNLGKSTEELEHQVDLMERAEEILKSGDVQTALNLFGNLVTANTARRDNYLAAEAEYEKQSDGNVEGSLAWQAARAEKMAEDAGRSKEEREEEKLRLQYIENIKEQFPQITSDTAVTADFLSNYSTEANKAYESYFGPRFDRFDKKRTELEDTIAGYEDEIKKYDDSIKEWTKIADNTDKSAADLEKLRQYSEMTFDELSKDSKLFQDWKKKIGDYHYKKDRYDISKQEGDNAWYKQLQKDIEEGKLTMTEQNYWLEVLKEQQEKQAKKEKEEAALAEANSNGSTNGGSSGGGSVGGNSGGSSTPSGSSNTPSGSSTNKLTPNLSSNPYGGLSSKEQEALNNQFGHTNDNLGGALLDAAPNRYVNTTVNTNMTRNGNTINDNSIKIGKIVLQDQTVGNTLRNAARKAMIQ